MGIRADLRTDNATCRRCAAPLSPATEIRRSWHLIRSGEHIGGRGEFLHLRCACGEKRRLLWTVQVAPQRRAA